MDAMNDIPRDELVAYAESAFGLGLAHGATRATPISSKQLKADILSIYPSTADRYVWRKIHRLKLRQVYGAGFDIAHTMQHATNGEH
jgi:hypothetical protein